MFTTAHCGQGSHPSPRTGRSALRPPGPARPRALRPGGRLQRGVGAGPRLTVRAGAQIGTGTRAGSEARGGRAGRGAEAGARWPLPGSPAGTRAGWGRSAGPKSSWGVAFPAGLRRPGVKIRIKRRNLGAVAAAAVAERGGPWGQNPPLLGVRSSLVRRWVAAWSGFQSPRLTVGVRYGGVREGRSPQPGLAAQEGGQSWFLSCELSLLPRLPKMGRGSWRRDGGGTGGT